MNKSITKRLTPLDFCYTFKKQGSTPIKAGLRENGMKQEYCGVVNTPNMDMVFSIFYDWGMHIKEEGIETFKFVNFLTKSKVDTLGDDYKFFCFVTKFFNLSSVEELSDWIKKQEVNNYRGICKDLGNDLHFSSVAKDEKPICYISYNKNAYTTHCTDYKNQKQWERERNPERYLSNLEKSYDSKNMYHCFRLIQMGIEIANGEGINLRRTHDRQFLLDVRNHKYEYDEVLEMALQKEEEMKIAMANTKLPKELDVELINELVIDAKKQFFKIY